MTKVELIAFLRSKLEDRWWEMHGPSIERQVDRYTESVKLEAARELLKDAANGTERVA